MSVAKIIHAIRFGWKGRAKEVLAVNNELKAEYRNRLEAVDILNNGAEALEALAEIAAQLAARERELAQHKRSTLEENDRDKWWEMSASGWAEGGLHRFGEQLARVCDSLNEATVAKQIRKTMCFQRQLPMPDPEPPETTEEPTRRPEHKATEATAFVGNVPYKPYPGPGWHGGNFGFGVSARNAELYSDYLNENEIEHLFTGGASGAPRLCFKTQADMNRALELIRK